MALNVVFSCELTLSVTLTLAVWVLHATHRLGMSSTAGILCYNLSVQEKVKALTRPIEPDIRTDGRCDFNRPPSGHKRSSGPNKRTVT